MFLKDFDREVETRRAVDSMAHNKMFSTHRGATPRRIAEIAVVCGNDGLGDDRRAQDGLDDVRPCLAREGIAEPGFGTAREGYSRAMPVRTTDDVALDNILRDAATFRARPRPEPRPSGDGPAVGPGSPAGAG